MYRSRPMSLAVLGLALWATGCAASIVDLDEVSDQERIRVLLVFRDGVACTGCGDIKKDSVWTIVENPRVVGDFIEGERNGGMRYRVAISDVRAIETDPASGWAIALVVVGVAGLVGIAALADEPDSLESF